MTGKTRQAFLIPVIIFSLILLPASPGIAGTLDGHVDAFGGWTGTVPYSNGSLSGTIDYAVFTAADFISNFGAVDYTPSHALVYTYQVINSGTAVVSAETVGVVNPAFNIGTFSIGDKDATSAALTPDAEWKFIGAGSIGSGETSYGLAFSSPNTPIVGVALTVDSGLTDLSIGVPTPGPNAIPEPASALLLIVGSVALLQSRRRFSRS